MSPSATATVKDVALLPVSTRGAITVLEAGIDVPFPIARCFIVRPGASAAQRGNHAHRDLNQFLVCLNGEIEVTVDDGSSQRTFVLNSSSVGLHVPPDIWSSQVYRTEESQLLVACDRGFSEADYIRDYEEFKRHVERKRAIGFGRDGK